MNLALRSACIRKHAEQSASGSSQKPVFLLVYKKKQNFRAQFCARKFCCNKSVYGNGYLKSGVASTSMSSNSIFSPPMAQMKV